MIDIKSVIKECHTTDPAPVSEAHSCPMCVHDQVPPTPVRADRVECPVRSNCGQRNDVCLNGGQKPSNHQSSRRSFSVHELHRNWTYYDYVGSH